MVKCIGVVGAPTIWLLSEVLNVEPMATRERANVQQEEKRTSGEDHRGRTRSSPSTRHIARFQNESQVSRTKHLDKS